THLRLTSHDYVVVFFFSSRRRHTRSKRDWSSDVCSSDLTQTTGTSPSRGRYRESVMESTCITSKRRVRSRWTMRLLKVGESRARSEERRVGKECRARGLGDE